MSKNLGFVVLNNAMSYILNVSISSRRVNVHVLAINKLSKVGYQNNLQLNKAITSTLLEPVKYILLLPEDIFFSNFYFSGKYGG